MCLEPARATVRGPAGFVAEVLDEASIPAFARHSVRAWNLLRTDPVELETSVRQALRVESPRFLTWVVRERPNGEILASATLAVKDEGIGYLMTAVVDPAHRRRGFYKLLLERRLAEARRLGLGLVVTWARETTSAPLLESFGFDTVFLGQAFARRGP
jgi:N-acetylglutamate synthase-like GNAT family acetyltransferase